METEQYSTGTTGDGSRRREPQRAGDRALPRMAVRGDAYDTGQTGKTNVDGMANFLGWFSIGLGLAQIVAPEAMSRLIGVDDAEDNATLMRTMGVREFSKGVGILATPRPEKWVWGRVAGDMLDLAALGKVMANPRNDRSKAIGATLAVLGVTALDYYTAKQLGRVDEDAVRVAHEPGMFTKRSVTINKGLDEVRSEWDAYARDLDWMNGEQGAEVDVRFEAAPGGRGTEVRVDLRYQPKFGVLGSKVQMLWRGEPGQVVMEDLRRFKQRLELGEEVVSDATYRKGMHPAQPPKEL